MMTILLMFDKPHQILLNLLNSNEPESSAPKGITAEDYHVARTLVRDYRVGPMISALSSQLKFSQIHPAKELLSQCEEEHRALMPRANDFAKSMMQTEEILTAQGISVIVLKGQALARSLYKDIGYKAMNDVDLLVRVSDYETAVELLLNAGFSYSERSPSWIERNKWVHHWAPLSSPYGVSIDLHWNITGKHGYGVNLEDLWTRSVILEGANSRLKRLGDLDQFVHQIVHFHFYRQRLSDTFDVIYSYRKIEEVYSYDDLIHHFSSIGALDALFRTASYCAQFTTGGDSFSLLATAVPGKHLFWRREIKKRIVSPQTLLTHRGRYIGDLEHSLKGMASMSLLGKVAALFSSLELALFPNVKYVRQLENDPSITKVSLILYVIHWCRLCLYYRRVI